jgi:hypothetical protein
LVIGRLDEPQTAAFSEPHMLINHACWPSASPS